MLLWDLADLALCVVVAVEGAWEHLELGVGDLAALEVHLPALLVVWVVMAVCLVGLEVFAVGLWALVVVLGFEVFAVLCVVDGALLVWVIVIFAL